MSLKQCLLVKHEFATTVEQLHISVLVADKDLVRHRLAGFLVDFSTSPNDDWFHLRYTCDPVTRFDEPSRLYLFQESLVLSRFLPLFDYSYLIEDGSQDQQIKAIVDKSIRLRQLIKIFRRIGSQFPIILRMYCFLMCSSFLFLRDR
jgi:hypothetical protein